MEGGNGDALPQYEAKGEDAIQPAGEERDGLGSGLGVHIAMIARQRYTGERAKD